MFDLATQQKLFNEYITPGVVAEIKARSKLYDKLRKEWKYVDVNGKYAKQKLLMEASQAAGASSTSDYPTAQESTAEETLVHIKRAMMFSLKFDGLALEMAANRGAEMDPMEFEKQGIFITISDDMSRQLMLDGSGRVCQANGLGSATATLTVDSPFYANATLHLKKNRLIDVYTGAGAKEVDGIAIASRDSATQVTLASAQSWTDDSWVRNKNTYAASEAAGLGEMMGLDGIIRVTDPPKPNATAGLQGLLVASYPEWVAHLFGNSGTPRDLSEDLIIQALDESTVYADCDVMLTTHGVRRAWFSILEAFKTLPNQKTMWGGWDGLPFIYDGKTIPMVPDKFVPDGCLYGLSEKNLILHVTTKDSITWEKGDAGTYLQKVANKNEYVAEGHFFGNLGTSLRKAFFKIYDLKSGPVA